MSGNPSGRPKGTHSIRAALRRRLRRDPDDDGIGREASESAERLIAAVQAGDEVAVRSLIALIHEVEGRPQETYDVTTSSRVLIAGEEPSEDQEALDSP